MASTSGESKTLLAAMPFAQVAVPKAVELAAVRQKNADLRGDAATTSERQASRALAATAGGDALKREEEAPELDHTTSSC